MHVLWNKASNKYYVARVTIASSPSHIIACGLLQIEEKDGFLVPTSPLCSILLFFYGANGKFWCKVDKTYNWFYSAVLNDAVPIILFCLAVSLVMLSVLPSQYRRAEIEFYFL